MKITDKRTKKVSDDFRFKGTDFLLIGGLLHCVNQVSGGKVQLVCFNSCANYALNRNFSDTLIDSKESYTLKDFDVPSGKEVEIVNVEILINDRTTIQ